jgi:molybdopterin/thiamine biosynthesis adenylyltransferase
MRRRASAMTATLVLPQGIVDELMAATRHPLETAGVLLASVVHANNGEIRLLGRKMLWVDESAYYRRERDGLSIASDGYVHALAQAEILGAVGIWVHTHPGTGALPLPSKHDQIVDGEIADLFRLRSGSAYYGAIIFSPRPPSLTFTGHLESDDGHTISIGRLWMVGDRFRLTRSFDSRPAQLSPIFDRNVRALGSAIQQTLGDIHVGIVGCGGIGSIIAEQLVRLGVRQITLIDPDELSASNVTRVYGSTAADAGRVKVAVLAEHLMQIAPDTICDPVKSMITLERVARHLTSCDVVFGCTDDNAGRLVLSRIATYLLTPVIDCGVLLTSDDDGRLIGIDGRVTTLAPGQACLLCRGRIDVARASAELLTPEERIRLEHEGYAPALGRTEPAVVSFTTIVGATAVSEFLERLIGYGPEPRPSEVLLRCHEREISTNVAVPREGHYCHPSTGKLGLGITTPFLEQTWAA